MHDVASSPAWVGPPLGVLEGRSRGLALTLGTDLVLLEDLLVALVPLREHSVETYAHSLRVGLLAGSLAWVESGPEVAYMALLGGVGHDAGKVKVPLSVLRAREFGEAQYEQVRVHPREGLRLLRGVHLPSALVAGLHHMFQHDPYGVALADAGVDVSPSEADSIMGVAELVSICDFFDALTTRDDKHLVADPADMVEVEAVLREAFPHSPARVTYLVSSTSGAD